MVKKKQSPGKVKAPALFADLFEVKSESKENEKKVDKSSGHQPLAQKKQFSSMTDLLARHQVPEKNKYVSREFQAFGCHLANQLGDQKHVSLYIKLAKNTPRGLLERALSFVSDANNARSKPKLFMWKLGQLKAKHPENNQQAASVKKD